MQPEYVIVWRFEIRPGAEKEFIEQYGPEGTWARFFRQSDGYIRTELVRDVAVEGRFLTLDYWQSEEQFNSFRKEHLAGYERLDKELEDLTERETRLGAFWFTQDLKMDMAVSTTVNATPQFYSKLLNWWRTQDSESKKTYFERGLSEDEIEQFMPVQEEVDHFTPRELRAYLLAGLLNMFWFPETPIPNVQSEWSGETQDWTLTVGYMGKVAVATIPGILLDEVLLRERPVQMEQLKDLLKPLVDIFN